MENPVKEITSIIHSLTQDPPSKQAETLYTYFTPTASFTHPFCRTGSFDGSRWVIDQIYRWYKIISPQIEIVVESIAFDEINLKLYVGMRQNFRLWIVPGYVADVSITTVLDLTRDPYTNDISNEGNSGSALRLDNVQDIHEKSERQEWELHHNNSNNSTGNKGVGGRGEEQRGMRNRNGSESSVRQGKYWIQSQNDLYQTSEWIKFLVPFGIGWRLVVAWQFLATFLCILGALALSPFSLLLQHVFGGNAERIRSGAYLGKD